MTEPERWTDAEWAAEQVALARRQAEVARAEARELRELRAELEAAREAYDADELAAARGGLAGMEAAVEYVARSVLGAEPGVPLEYAARAVVAERDQLRADLAHNRNVTVEARHHAAVRAELDAMTDERDALRGSLATIARTLTVDGEGPDQRLVDGVVDAASAARRGAPRVVAEGRDPATRTRAETPPYDPGNCESCRNPIEGDYYRNREPGDIGGENYHRDCWAWVRSCGKGPRPRRYREEHKPSPCIALSAEQVHEALGRNVPAPTRALPVVPETCGECRYISGDPWTCGHPGGEHEQVGHGAAPHDECPLRAKAGGA